MEKAAYLHDQLRLIEPRAHLCVLLNGEIVATGPKAVIELHLDRYAMLPVDHVEVTKLSNSVYVWLKGGKGAC